MSSYVRIKNTANDRTKAHLHRLASRFELEPSIAGQRIRLNSYIDLTPEAYERAKPFIDEWVKKGMVEVTTETVYDRPPGNIPYDDNGLRLDGPIFEEWVARGYRHEDYPPSGYAEKPSPGLSAYRAELAAKIGDLPSPKKEELPPVLSPEAQMEANISRMAQEIAADVDAQILSEITAGAEAAAAQQASAPVEIIAPAPVAPPVATPPPAPPAPVTPAPRVQASEATTTETKKSGGKKKLF